MLTRKNIALLFSNFAAFVVVFIAVYSALVGTDGKLGDNNLDVFKYFTVQSNVFVGLTSLLTIIFFIIKKNVPNWLIYVKLTSTTAVIITFSVVLFYLAPVMGVYVVYTGVNFIMHLLVPLLAFFEFLFFVPKIDIKVKSSFLSMIPTFIYGTFYLTNVVINNGYGDFNYDWYLLGVAGIWMGLISFSVILGFSFLISFLISFLHKKISN